MKKIIIALNLLVISLFIFGCNDNETTIYNDDNFNVAGDKIVDDKITLRFFAPLHPLHDSEGFNSMKLFEKMEEITNIHIEWIYGPTATYDEKRALALQDYENIDAFFLWNSLDEQVEMAELGVIRPIDDLLSVYSPNYYNILESNPEYRKISTLDDGHIYSTVVINDVPRDQTFKQYINTEWLDNLGLDMPETIEEYYDILKAFKNDDPNQNGIPDEIPLSSAKLYQTRNFLMSAFGYVSTGIEVEGEDVIYVPSTDNYREYLELTHRLYSEGLLDNSTYTMSNSDLAAKGYLVGSFDSAAAYLVAGVENNSSYEAINPLTSEINSEKMWLGFNSSTPSGIMITENSEYYKEILRWIDYLYSEEGIMLQAFGEEGTDFTWDDEAETSFTFNVPSDMNMESFRGTLTPSVGLGSIAFWSKDFVLKDNNELTTSINQSVDNAGYLDYLKIPYPQAIFTEAETNQVAIILTDLSVYMQIFEEKMVTGKTELTNATWQEHLDNLDQLGFQDLIDVYQAAYDRYMEK
jgi:putative aldouronate transport system substrate-binding protein